MRIGKTTFYELKKSLVKDGVLSKIDVGYSLSKELFHTPDYMDAIETYKEELDARVRMNPDYRYDKAYRAFHDHYDTGFKNLRMPVMDFLMALESGTYFRKGKNEPDVVPLKEYPL